MTSTLAFTKGHGTQNDFVLVLDDDGRRGLTAQDVRYLADRRAGIGGDGVIRIVPTLAAGEAEIRAQAGQAAWFMDYRNADGSLAEMCGNGARVFAAYLRQANLEQDDAFAIATRAGVKPVRIGAVDAQAATYDVTVDMGTWRLSHEQDAADRGFDTLVGLPGCDPLPGLSVNLGNPHTVVALPERVELDEVDLTRPPLLNPDPASGSNVELVRLVGDGHLRMRVHERGVGETRSCGTGAVAAALAMRTWSGAPEEHDAWLVDVPGGRVRVRALPGHRAELSGPAVLIADGVARMPW